MIKRTMPWALIGAACLGSFAATSSGTTRAPFLIEMSHDLGVSIGLVANLVSFTATAWGIASATAGSLSDRIGRRWMLIGGLFGLSIAMLGQSMAGNFLWVVVWATLCGGCAGTFTGVVYAEVSARVEDYQRGRALGWVMTGQSLTLVVGVPMAAFIGSMIGWRGWNVCMAGLALSGAIAIVATVSRSGKTRHAARPPSLRNALSRQVIGLLSTGICERVCYGMATIYFATFLQEIYGLSLAGIAVPLALMALGNIGGTVLGGQIADRLRDRLLTYATAMVLQGGAALALFVWHPNATVSVVLGFLYALVNATGRPSYMAALANVPDHVRGTVLGLNGATASVGWVGAAALGAILIGTVGFEGFGPLAAVLSLLGAAGALANRQMKISI
jgi:predicted MFS family arabinose efflux permease